LRGDIIEDNPTLAGIIIGASLGYWLWGNEPAYIDNLKMQEESEFGGAYVLSKYGNEQTAVFHGFYDDFNVCLKVKRLLESEGGWYECTRYDQVGGGTPWWKVWDTLFPNDA